MVRQMVWQMLRRYCDNLRVPLVDLAAFDFDRGLEVLRFLDEELHMHYIEVSRGNPARNVLAPIR